MLDKILQFIAGELTAILSDITNLKNGLLPLDTTAATGTVDGDLYAAITALEWEGDVIDA